MHTPLDNRHGLLRHSATNGIVSGVVNFWLWDEVTVKNDSLSSSKDRNIIIGRYISFTRSLKESFVKQKFSFCYRNSFCPSVANAVRSSITATLGSFEFYQHDTIWRVYGTAWSLWRWVVRLVINSYNRHKHIFGLFPWPILFKYRL